MSEQNLSPITPYAAAKVANTVLAAKGEERVITPQMMYSYAKNDRIATVDVPGTNKVHFDGNAFKTWLTGYINNTTSTGRQDYNKLAAQYMVADETEEVEETVDAE
jgi:hypothetical protein